MIAPDVLNEGISNKVTMHVQRKSQKSPEDFGHGQAESYVRKIDQKKKLKHD